MSLFFFFLPTKMTSRKLDQRATEYVKFHHQRHIVMHESIRRLHTELLPCCHGKVRTCGAAVAGFGLKSLTKESGERRVAGVRCVGLRPCPLTVASLEAQGTHPQHRRGSARKSLRGARACPRAARGRRVGSWQSRPQKAAVCHREGEDRFSRRWGSHVCTGG